MNKTKFELNLMYAISNIDNLLKCIIIDVIMCALTETDDRSFLFGELQDDLMQGILNTKNRKMWRKLKFIWFNHD